MFVWVNKKLILTNFSGKGFCSVLPDLETGQSFFISSECVVKNMKQIGRASCRERVSSPVYIEVADGRV